MGFEVYVFFYGEAKEPGIGRETIRSLFPVVEAESGIDDWSVRYDSVNSCRIGVSPLEPDASRLCGMFVDRPCGDIRLWEGLLSILRMGSITLFWPGGPPVIANEASAAELPAEMIESIGPPRVVGSAAEIFELLKET